jgi:uncharacterized membrane protein YeaQ/YmgE (transglycosylase-associated protein family)
VQLPAQVNPSSLDASPKFNHLILQPCRTNPGSTRAAIIWLPAKKYRSSTQGVTRMGILWTIIIGFIAGVIAKFIMPGDKEPSGFIMTTILGIVGAFVASYLGQALGWYSPGEGAGLIGAVVGAIIVLFVYGLITSRQTT